MSHQRTKEVVERIQKLHSEMINLQDELAELQALCEHEFGPCTVITNFPSRMCKKCEYIELV